MATDDPTIYRYRTLTAEMLFGQGAVTDPAIPPESLYEECIATGQASSADIVTISKALLDDLVGLREEAIRERDVARQAQQYAEANYTAIQEADRRHQLALRVEREHTGAEAAELAALRKAFIGPDLRAEAGEKYRCRLVWWPDEWRVLYIDGAVGSRTLAPWSAPPMTGQQGGVPLSIGWHWMANGPDPVTVGLPTPTDPSAFPARALRSFSQQTGARTP